MLTEKHKNSDNVFSAVEKEEVVKTKEVMVETSNKIKKDIIEVKELEKKVRSSFVRPTSIPKAIRDASKKATTDKEEIGEAEQKKEPIENVIVEPEVLIVESVEKVEEIPLENSIIVAQEIVPIVKSEDNVIEPETVPVKKITKQDKKKIISTLLTQEYLFSARNFNVAPHPQEISFLCKVVENDKNYLYFRKGGINKSLTDVLKDLYGQHDKKAKEVFLLLDFVVERVFIADLTNPSLFKTDVIKIEVDEKLLFGTSIQDRYLCPVTQELLIREAKISEGKRAVYFNDLVDLFTRGKHEAI